MRRDALPGHKLGPDHPWWDPKHPVTSGKSLKMCLAWTTRCISKLTVEICFGVRMMILFEEPLAFWVTKFCVIDASLVPSKADC